MPSTHDEERVRAEVLAEIDAGLSFGRDLRRWARERKVSAERLEAVLALWGAGREGLEVDVGGLAERLGAAPSTMSRNVGRLERDGLVERLLGEGDGRRSVLGLTREGRRLAGWVVMKVWARWGSSEEGSEGKGTRRGSKRSGRVMA